MERTEDLQTIIILFHYSCWYFQCSHKHWMNFAILNVQQHVGGGNNGGILPKNNGRK